MHQGLVYRSSKMSGSQSDVYLVRGINESKDKILKIIRQKDFKSFQFEKHALLELKSNNHCDKGFPNLISVMEGKDHAEMLIDAQGQNLRKLYKELLPLNRFSTATCYKIVIQLLERIEVLHSLNLVHNDLKLENFVIGIDNPQKIFLIDFGLTQKFIEDNGQHTAKTYYRSFSGNFLFASLNSCRGFNKSRRDDVESIFYILIYLLNKEFLPWCDLLCKDQ